MKLLKELVQLNLIEEQLLTQMGAQSAEWSDMECLRHLSRQQLIQEERLLFFFSKRYDLPLFSRTSPLSSPFPNRELCRYIFQETQVLMIVLDGKYVGLLSLQADLFSLDKISFYVGAPISWYWCTSQYSESLWLNSDGESWAVTETSIIELTEDLLEQAIGQRASDVHIEGRGDELKVRIRVDGNLKECVVLPIETQAPLLSRFKILAGMDVAVRRRPQDGGYSYEARNGNIFDLRISSIPTTLGEKLVIRLLDQTPILHRLEALGFFQEDLNILHRACHLQSGLILVVGPTGSGKTTTLYAMLNEMDAQTQNIMTIEDPVEYHISRINQVAVHPEQNLTFSKALRTFLRQDPDVILVGEIRDEETAQIAIKAALTGHLVLSTLHCVDVKTTIQRLTSLGVDEDLLADTLKVIVAQRLVRRRCDHGDHGQTCERCRGTGYWGRVPAYEILQVNQTIRERIKGGHSGNELIIPHSGVYYHTFEQTIARLIQDGLTDSNETEKLMSW